MRTPILLALVSLHVVLLAHSFAQTSNATLGGTVSDATGAFIPGVTLTATNTATGIVNTVTTNEAGAYQFASLQTGTYKVSAELPGFQTQTYENVTLGISQQARLNFALKVGSVAQAVEVTVAADTLIATSSSSVGNVLPEYKVRDLPLGARNVLDLILTSSGVSNAVNTAGQAYGAFEGDTGVLAGGRLSAVNTTRDGFVVTDGRYLDGAFSVTYTSSDLVEEVRVITAPVDAEAGRGSGQVQMVTRSGTNQFRGSAFWNNKNSVLAASNWFNNFNRVPKDWENRNQFGVRLGGPIIRNKTFFFFLVDEQRDIFKQTFVGAVLTPQARQGIFRYFPGADNQNAVGSNPAVDRSGNPVRPAGATGDLQSFNIFADASGRPRDALRPGFDPTGLIPNKVLGPMPVPNDYTIGDGLNTAGIRWTRRLSGWDQSGAGNQSDQLNRDQFNLRVDHNFSPKHKLSVVYTWERNINNGTQAGLAGWPGGDYGAVWRWPKVFTASFVSTLSPSLVNEARAGYKTTKRYSWAPWYVGRFNEGDQPNADAQKAFARLPVSNGVPYNTQMTLLPDTPLNFGTSFTAGTTSFSNSPSYTLADTLSWTRGHHAFKAGGEWRYGYTRGGNDTNMTPLVIFGAGGPPVTGIDNTTIAGLSANNQVTARNLLTDLAGSVSAVREGSDIRDPRNPKFLGYADGARLRLRDWRADEVAWFFKDSWKARPDFTLNMGIHWEWFGTPYEKSGLAAAPIGGDRGLCGISCGSPTAVQFIAKNSPNPGVQAYPNTYNNFAPSFGFSWSLPWFGKDKTVLRAGYGWSFTGGPLKGAQSVVASILSPPGAYEGSGGTNNGITYTQSGYLSLANLSLPIAHQLSPLQTPPLDGGRAESIQAYTHDRRDPYIQNFNLEIQRELANNLTLDVAYIGTKGTSLWGGMQLDTVDIFRNKFLDAFNTTRAGGDAIMFDDMLRGLNFGSGVINGTTVTGSASLRANTLSRAFIANGSVGQLADFLNRSTTVTGKGGGLVRNSGLFPENFFVVNPQFQSVVLHANPGSSTYHSLQIQTTKRLSHGVTAQTSYTWSRALGENDGDGAIDYRDPNNRSSNHALLGFHRTHGFQSNGTLELPFGPNRKFMGNAPAVLQRLVERWQLGGIFSWFSGAPLSIVAPNATITPATAGLPIVTTPSMPGDFPKSMGKVTKVSNGVTYFPGLQQITDPSAAGVTSLNALSGSFSNKAIADSQGRPLLVNPAPGQIGTMGLKWIEGPSTIALNVNLLKRVRLTETKELELRADAVNALNHPNFGFPNLNINSTGNGTTTGIAGTNVPFGRITAATGDRKITVGARLNF